MDLNWITRRLRTELGSNTAQINMQNMHDWLRVSGWPGYTYLRTYVYDGRREQKSTDTAQQRQVYDADQQRLDGIAEVPGVNLRTGKAIERTDSEGAVQLQQKGVDTLLVLDMLELADQGAYQAAILVAGDSDFVEVVRAVQDRGIRVAQGGLSSRHGVSKDLRQIVDDFIPIPEPMASSLLAQ